MRRRISRSCLDDDELDARFSLHCSDIDLYFSFGLVYRIQCKPGFILALNDFNLALLAKICSTMKWLSKRKEERMGGGHWSSFQHLQRLEPRGNGLSHNMI